MITLVGRWESGWLPHRTEYFMWKQLAAAYKVDRLVMVGKSGEPRIPIDQYDTIQEALETCTGDVFLLESKGKVLLADTPHSEDAVYVFGNAMNDNRDQDGITVRIETPSQTALFAINAAAIVLEARRDYRQ
jgi:tRNA(Leu) C34 or U34 (ribose-2'-O)-methylase TrmL